MALSKDLKEVRKSSGVSEGESIPGRGDSCEGPEMRVLTSSRNKKRINVAEAVSAFRCVCMHGCVHVSL